MSKLYSQEELIKYVDVLKITVPRMNKLSIPLTPENYAVWYEYSQGSNLALNAEIDNYLNDGVAFSEEVNTSLYKDHISIKTSEELSNAQSSTKVFIQQLIQKMQNMSVGSNRFGSALNECKQLLQGEPDVVQLTGIVSQVLQETEVISQSNQEMLGSLKTMEKEVEQLRAGVESLTETAYTDQLTNIANRRAFDQKIEALFEEIETSCFSLLLMDIDHFKAFNDTHGHAVGDKVLIYVANLLKKGVVGKGLAARYGGEEFVVLLPEFDNSMAVEMAESLRMIISERNLTSAKTKEKMGNITISVGVATATKDDNSKSLTERADKAMYSAKSDGRNRVANESDLLLL